MINWPLLLPIAIVIIIAAELLARAVTGATIPYTPDTPSARPKNASVLLATLLRFELPLLVLLAPLFLFTTPLTVVAFALIPLLWATRWLVRGYILPRTPLDWPIAITAIMIPVSLLVDPYASWGMGRAAFLLYGIALYYALVDWISSSSKLDIALTLYLFAGGVVSLLSLVGTDWQYKLPFLGDLTHVLPQLANVLSRDQTGFHPNIVAGALLWFIFPIFALLLVTPASTPQDSGFLARLTYRRTPMILLLVLTGGTLLLTQSRAALASAAVGLGLLVWFKWPRLRLAILVAGVVAAAIISIALTLEISAGKEALPAGEFSASAADNFAVRIDTWQSALTAISVHPVEGIGLDAFRHLLPTTYPAASVPSTYDIGHAHNQFLQAALDLGLLGLLGYLALWLAAGRMSTLLLIRSIGASTSRRLFSRSTALAAGFAASLLASFIHGMIDVVVMVSKPGVLFWAMLALMAALWRLTAAQRQSTLQE